MGGLAVCGQEQGHVVVLLLVRHGKDDFNIWIEPFQAIPLIVGGGFEVDTVNARLQGLRWRQQMFAAAIRVSNGFANKRPSAFSHEGEGDRNFCAWSPHRDLDDSSPHPPANSTSTP